MALKLSILKTPWDSIQICDENGDSLISVNGWGACTEATFHDEGQAKEIVEACNAYEALKAAAEACLDYATIDGWLNSKSSHGNDVFGIRKSDLLKLRDALSKANGGA